MNGCNKILIKNGGKLIMNNTEIGYCDWQGIEAGGCYDCCQLGMSGFGVCDYPNCHRLAVVEIEDCKIHHADIGVFLGLRNDDNGCAYLGKDYSGGAVLSLTNSVMSNNYVDVMFREYDITISEFNSGCEIDATKKKNQSIIRDNYFINPITVEHCDTFASNLITTKGSPISRCHIVDLAEILFTLPLSVGQSLRGYLGPYNPPFASTPNKVVLPNILNNYYSSPCAAAKYYK
jgi:hypothetical protein